jgi:hypothetical protein
MIGWGFMSKANIPVSGLDLHRGSLQPLTAYRQHLFIYRPSAAFTN